MLRCPPDLGVEETIRDFTTVAALRRHLAQTGARYADLGASKGGSRLQLETIMRKAGVDNTVESCFPVTIGLDISDAKLRICNQGKPFELRLLNTSFNASGNDGIIAKVPPLCVKADLGGLLGKGSAHQKPLLDGTQMIDILEHINRPLPAAAQAAVPPTRVRHVLGQYFDTGDHGMAKSVWRAACAVSRLFCYMEGPSFDNLERLEASGFAPYWSRWSGHTAHVNSTSMVAALRRLPRAHKAAKLVLLSRPISTSASNSIVRVPPAHARACRGSDLGRFALGCDRHAEGSREEGALALPALKYIKSPSAPVDLLPFQIFTRMTTLVAYDFDAKMNTMSKATAAMFIFASRRFALANRDVAPQLQSQLIRLCELPSLPSLSTKECYARLRKAARQALSGVDSGGIEGMPSLWRRLIYRVMG